MIQLGEARRVLERVGAHLVGCVAGRWVGLRDGVEIYLSGDVGPSERPTNCAR